MGTSSRSSCHFCTWTLFTTWLFQVWRGRQPRWRRLGNRRRMVYRRSARRFGHCQRVLVRDNIVCGEGGRARPFFFKPKKKSIAPSHKHSPESAREDVDGTWVEIPHQYPLEVGSLAARSILMYADVCSTTNTLTSVFIYVYMKVRRCFAAALLHAKWYRRANRRCGAVVGKLV